MAWPKKYWKASTLGSSGAAGGAGAGARTGAGAISGWAIAGGSGRTSSADGTGGRSGQREQEALRWPAGAGTGGLDAGAGGVGFSGTTRGLAGAGAAGRHRNLHLGSLLGALGAAGAGFGASGAFWASGAFFFSSLFLPKKYWNASGFFSCASRRLFRLLGGGGLRLGRLGVRGRRLTLLRPSGGRQEQGDEGEGKQAFRHDHPRIRALYSPSPGGDAIGRGGILF